MNAEEIKNNALSLLEYFESRFQENGNDSVPVQILLRWINAFSREEPDLDEIAEIMREGAKYQYDGKYQDMRFFMFCNDMKDTYRKLFEEYIHSKDNKKSGS